MNFHDSPQSGQYNNYADEKVLSALLLQLQTKDAQLAEKDEMIKQLIMKIKAE